MLLFLLKMHKPAGELGGTGEVNTLSKGRSVGFVLVLNLLVSEAKYPNSST